MYLQSEMSFLRKATTKFYAGKRYAKSSVATFTVRNDGAHQSPICNE